MNESEDQETEVRRSTNFGPWQRNNYDDIIISLPQKDATLKLAKLPSIIVPRLAKAVESDLHNEQQLRSIQHRCFKPQKSDRSIDRSQDQSIGVLRQRISSTIHDSRPRDKQQQLEFKLVSINMNQLHDFNTQHFPKPRLGGSQHLPNIRSNREYQQSLERMVLRKHESKNGRKIHLHNHMITHLLQKLSSLSLHEQTRGLAKYPL